MLFLVGFVVVVGQEYNCHPQLTAYSPEGIFRRDSSAQNTQCSLTIPENLFQTRFSGLRVSMNKAEINCNHSSVKIIIDSQ